MREQAREKTFRIRNPSGIGAGTGAGFAVGPHLIVTNRHVVEGDDPLEVSTWDGRVLEVAAADMAPGHDLAALRTVRTLQTRVEFAQRPARPGDLVYVVGYPLGCEFTVIRGLVVDEVEGSALGGQPDVLRVKAVVLPGYSGGPVLNVDGEVVGVVYALGRATRYALTIPVSSLWGWLDSAPLRHLRTDRADRDEPRDAEAGA
ncbi:MAG: serine protease [Actinomycetota bacterium]|nr:serine protease [Actinomycetota bacterium]